MSALTSSTRFALWRAGRSDRQPERRGRLQQPRVVGDEGLKLIADRQCTGKVDGVEAAKRQ